MKRRRTKKDGLLDIAKKMSPLHHKRPGRDFDWKESEAVGWLISQPEILDFVWQSVHNKTGSHGGKALIVFDPETHTWKGVDYGDDQLLHADDTADLHAPREAGDGGQGQAGVL